MRRTISFLVNPYSGGQRGRALIKQLHRVIHSREISGQIIELDLDKFEEQSRQALQSELIVIAGGDGTINNLLPYLLNSKKPLAIIPLGTGNDLARELKLKSSYTFGRLISYLTRCQTADARPIAVWKLSYGQDFSGSRLFCNYFSIGFDAAVVRDFAASRSERGHYLPGLGRLGNRIGYLIAALKNLGKLPRLEKVQCRADKAQALNLEPAITLFFPNIHNVAGLAISEPSSNPSDQEIELLQINSVWNYVSMLAHHKLPLPKARLVGAASSWEISGLPLGLTAQVDGEALSGISSSHYRIELAGSIDMINF